MRSDVVSAVLDKGHETIIVTDSTKFGLKYPYTLGPTERISRVVTDDGLDTDIRAALKRHSLQLAQNIHNFICYTYNMTTLLSIDSSGENYMLLHTKNGSSRAGRDDEHGSERVF